MKDEVQHVKGKLLGAYRWHPEQVPERKNDLAVVKIKKFITQELADGPPLTPQQYAHLSAALTSVRVRDE